MTLRGATSPDAGDTPDTLGIRTTASNTSRTWLTRLVTGPHDDPNWARPALLALLAATAVLYLWNLTASGWANAFYSAAAQAGSQNWEAFFFGSSDAANSITVDKPPASLWVMALSVRLLGLSSFSILVPQVLMGVATVAILHATVKRHFGAGAGLLAGLVMALTPVAVLMFRFNNPDALLVLLMTAAAWATMRALERGSVRWMALVGVLLGFGFLTKTLQVFLVIPGFGAAFLLLAAAPLRRRLVGSLVALVALVASAGWWVAIVELTPASMRPYVGGSQSNSFLDLTFGYNGFGRLSGEETGSVGGGGGAAGGQWGSTGLTRLFDAEIGGQISWLIPAAIILGVMGVVMRARAPRTDVRRAAYAVWGGWLLETMLTFSLMAGIFHAYYTVALAPAVAALVGMGGAQAWERRREPVGTLTMAAAAAASSIWGFVLLSRTSAYSDVLRVGVLTIGLTCAALLVIGRRLHARALPVIVVGAVVAGLAGPTAYSLTTLTSGHTGSIVTAGPASGGMGGMPGAGGRGPGARALGGSTVGAPPAASSTTRGTVPTGAGGQGVGGGGMGGLLDATTPSAAVISALRADAQRYTWVAAAVGSQSAAGLQLGTGEPVMAIGGFNGTDPSPTLAQFQAEVKAGKIHYLLASGGTSTGGGTSSAQTSDASRILAWAEATYRQVTIGSTVFYDLTQPLD